ncbi:MAG TPA: hypothetical protein VNE58_07435 [Casimicrobiaceae bacterium]|nr:hypothetical protein [Casimicrobiaceae bacterium]
MNANRDSYASRIAVVLANAIAFAVLAAVAAYWGWRWLGPSRVHLPPPVTGDPASVFAASPPFGSGNEAAPPVVATTAAASPDVRLLGVLSQRDGRGQALFRLPDGGATLVDTGNAIRPGTTLVSVQTDGVTVRDDAGERTIALRSQPAPPGTSAASRAAVATSPACTIPADFKGGVVRLNAELVQGLMAQPEALRSMAHSQGDALVISEESGFAAMLGMRKGDRVTQANGIALRAPDDVIVAVLRPLAASQPVRLVGTRGNEARELMVLNASVCNSR